MKVVFPSPDSPHTIIVMYRSCIAPAAKSARDPGTLEASTSIVNKLALVSVRSRALLL